ncbi:MAG: hypothetical protein IJ400_02565 [Clostridia bacterium]|nr:hypothetical protein [Clostridia bacterium]
MTLGEIKLEALMLMYPEMRLPVDSELAEEMLNHLSQGSLYCDLIASMDQSISRALFYIELWELTKLKRQVVKINREEWCEYYLPMPQDAFLVTEVLAKSSSGNIPVSFVALDNEICVLEKSEEYIVEYREKAMKINATTSLSTKLSLSNEVEVIIPYFIKGELYKESQKEASICLERFFSALDRLASIPKGRVECRISPYKIV